MRVIMMDVDGVLVAGRPKDGALPFTDLETDLGIPLEVLRREFFASRWPAIVTGQKPLLPELADVLAQISPQVSAETLMDYWFRNDSRIDTSVLQGMAELRAQGDRVYLATNQEHLRAAYLMKNMGLADHVDGIFYSAALGYRKPAPEFFAQATEAAGVPRGRIVLIDDTEENVLAARAAGWSAVHWKSGMLVGEELARRS